ncbi:MAG: NADH-ubiquinone/plastoquinone oxidoreductase chain 6 [Sediminibacterium sp.]|nr:NADH-ubiquinone/plastoquinone oxidoreductase chain 6 [Sediminibacterium sp.]
MSASAVIFYLISAFMLGTGLLAVTAKKIFRSAIWLLFSLVGIAALYFWMQVEFIAAVQIIVYVGGIVVLIIFSIFLTQNSGKEMPRTAPGRMVFSLLAALFGLLFTWQLINRHYTSQPTPRPFNNTINEIGTQLLSTSDYGYILPFEVVSILLLAAMIGCIVIAMKNSGGNLEIPAESKLMIHSDFSSPPKPEDQP